MPKITLPGYKRMAFNSTYCLVASCHNRQSLHRIHLAIRLRILAQQSIYIPQGTRICEEHLGIGTLWNNLVTHCRPTHDTFTSAQIVDMMKILQKKDLLYLNFEKLDTIDNSVFRCYTGHSKEDFMGILDKCPSLLTLKKSKTALAMVLCKLHTGESNQSMASFFRMPKVDFVRLLKKTQDSMSGVAINGYPVATPSTEEVPTSSRETVS